MSHRRNCHVLVLVLIAMGVLASPSFAAPPQTTFTATETPTSPLDPSLFVPLGDSYYVLGAPEITFIESSDPRLTGTGTHSVYAILSQADFTGPMWGTLTIKNDHGAWTGTWQGQITREGDDRISAAQAVLVGSGDYAGLVAYLSPRTINDGPRQATGYISKGKVIERPMKLNDVVTILDADMNPAHWTWLAADTVVIPWTAQEAGVGTHLGEFQATYTGGSIVKFTLGGMEFVTQWSDAVFTAANGDTLLVFVVPGPEEGTLLGMIRGGTGRFANARGSMIWTGDTDPDDPSVYFGAYDGTITY